MTTGVDVIETHISYVFLAGDRAYKMKKPVRLPFLDYSDIERRRALCHEEVRLNRRLAPSIYLGVRALVPDGNGGLALAQADAPGAVEYVVEMQRIAPGDTLDRRIAAGQLADAQLDAIARGIAEFHRTTAPAASAPTVPFRTQLRDALATLRENLPASEAAQIGHLGRTLEALCDSCADELDRRAATGFVRDCHGDLRAEHVIVGPPVQIFDCIEFNPGLRQIDVGSDLGFLLMDLEHRGAADVAAQLLDRYRAHGGDPGTDKLVALFCAYRACVRAMVAALRAGQLSGDDAEASRTEAHDLYSLAWRFAWRAQPPVVIAVCGPAASGKTTLARALAAITGLPHFSSDRTRKALAGLAPTEHGTPSLYSDDMSTRVYESLGQMAGDAMAGKGAIVDATFRRTRERDLFRAQLGDTEPVFVECRAPGAVLLTRAEQRSANPRSESDAGPEQARIQLAEFEPLDELPVANKLSVSTARSVAEIAAEVAADVAAGARREAQSAGSIRP